MQLLDYLKALTPKAAPGVDAAVASPLEHELAPRVASPARLERFRALTAYPDDGYLPLTWPYVEAFPTHLHLLVDARFPLQAMGTLHVGLKIHQHRPIGAGERLRLHCQVESPRTVDKGWQFDQVTRVYCGEELAWESRATMLRRRPGVAPAPILLLDRPPLDGVGATNQIWRASADLGRKMALLTGDLNPIHLHTMLARLFGFRSTIAHGIWTATRSVATQPEMLRGPKVTAEWSFKKPVPLPGNVLGRWWPDGKNGVQLRVLEPRSLMPHLIGSLRQDLV